MSLAERAAQIVARHKGEDRAVRFVDLARRLGCEKSAVTALRHAGRLAFTDDGRRVWLLATCQRITATADPAKDAVAARHEATRQAQAGTPVETAPDDGSEPASPDDGSEPASPDAEAPADPTGYQHWRMRREKAAALAAERDLQVSEGKLLDAGQVRDAVTAAVTTIRTQIEAVPYDLAPELCAITDEAQMRARMVEAFEHALEELSRALSVLGAPA